MSLCRVLLFALASALLASSAASAAESQWESDIRQFEADDAAREASKAPPVEVLFLGSSSIRLWPLAESFPGVHVLNRGFGGSQFADAVEFADRILARHKPRAVVIYSGDNDIAAGKTPEQVRDDFQSLAAKIGERLPHAKIVLIGIKPSIKRWALIDNIRRANQLLSEACASHSQAIFIDVEPHMLGGDLTPRKELLVEDGLHLSPAGYEIWTKLVAAKLAPAGDYKPAEGRLLTRWAKEVSPANALPEHPRPQLRRDNWTNLNGLWEYAITPKDAERPSEFSGEILVPYPIEAALSGVMKTVGPEKRLWYRRHFEAAKPEKGRLHLHFGAVDWGATVWVNGKKVGEHRGGYDPFSFDITDALADSGKQEIVVGVWDPSDAGTQPRGKQIREPHGIWYTPVTGIWQTVWLEETPSQYLSNLKIAPDVDRGMVVLSGELSAEGAAVVTAAVEFGGERIVSAKVHGGPKFKMELQVPGAKLWSPDSPHLYDLQLTVESPATGERDEVASYFGMRKIALGKDERGINRLFLNNEPLFQFGPLDQGWWPDGLYTAPTDDALRYDVEITKRLGFNMARKHVKVEPARGYYWCDKLGLLVWQDMPSGDRYIGPQEADIERTPESAEQFMVELRAMIDAFGNHPSIVMWVPFNEGWGQFDTAKVAQWVKEYDPSRLVNSVSGWADRGVGDVLDWHIYPGPASPPAESERAVVLGEFGGLGLPVKGHTWQDEKNWGYRSFTSPEALGDAYESLVENLRPLIGSPGLAAAVYTQTTDVEIEVNGLLTYDRAVLKIPLERVAAVNRRTYLPPPVLESILADSREAGQTWRYTFDKPADDWESASFDDSSWKEGLAGFGQKGTPGAVVRTVWESSDIWLRREFEIEGEAPEASFLMLHHDEDAEVYINEVLACQVTGYTTSYGPKAVLTSARKSLQTGRNVIAVHCRQTGGGQYIDVGLLEEK